MRARMSAGLLLCTFVLLVRLPGCDINESQCCYDIAPQHFDTWQELATAVAECEGSMSYGCQEHRGSESIGFCLQHPQDCCEHFPELASRALANTQFACASWVAAPAATATPVPLESELQVPPHGLAPVEPLPGEKPEPPAPVLVLPKVVTVTPSPTPPPKVEVISVPPPPCLAPPIMFDPPDGKTFAAINTVFRWKPGCELGSDLVYDVLVSTDGGKTSTSIGTTGDTILPIDFLKWNFAGFTGNFSWTVRIRDASGKYVSCESQWFVMTLTDIRGGPPGVPVPNEPPPKPPCYTKPCP